MKIPSSIVVGIQSARKASSWRQPRMSFFIRRRAAWKLYQRGIPSQSEEAIGQFEQALASAREVKDRAGEGATRSDRGAAQRSLCASS